MSAILILSILILILIQTSGNLTSRADYSKCVANLRNLYVAAGSHVQEQGHWPQIPTALNRGGGEQYSERWIQALKKYGISRESWICPTAQRQLGFPDIHEPKNRRIDYMATPFDRNQITPYRWSTQPWFVEKSSSHPGGNLVIYSDGQVLPLKDAIRRTPGGE